MNLYLDVDGVLLGKERPDDVQVTLARHLPDFLEFALGAFDCYWLTTHCRGDAGAVLDYLRPYCAEDLLVMLRRIRPSSFRILKTEALQGDFYWLDDAPLASERAWLRERGLLDRWIEVNTRSRPDDLLRATSFLRDAAGRRP